MEECMKKVLLALFVLSVMGLKGLEYGGCTVQGSAMKSAGCKDCKIVGSRLACSSCGRSEKDTFVSVQSIDLEKCCKNPKNDAGCYYNVYVTTYGVLMCFLKSDSHCQEKKEEGISFSR
jgi:hypothetical protein